MRRTESDVVRASAPRLHEGPCAADAGTQAGIGRGADGDRRLEVPCREQPRCCPEPAGQRLRDPLACGRRGEEPTIEQHEIGTDHPPSGRQGHGAVIGRKDGRRAREKRRQVARDRRIGFVRQPELAQAGAAIAAAAFFIRPRQRQEFMQRRLHVIARQIDGHRVADERPAGAEDGDRHAVRRRLAEHPFLGRAAQPPDRRPLRHRQPHVGAGLGDPALDDRGEREIEVVAAEEQVIADRHAFERRRRRLDPDPNQTEVGRAASDVTDKCNLHRLRGRSPSAVSAIHA